MALSNLETYDLEMFLQRKARAKISQIEAELKRVGRWQADPLPPEKFENMGAFGANTMTPEQWLQFVLVPKIQEILQTNASFPKGSQVATWAYRNFDGAGTDALCQLLSEFDELFK